MGVNLSCAVTGPRDQRTQEGRSSRLGPCVVHLSARGARGEWMWDVGEEDRGPRRIVSGKSGESTGSEEDEE